MNLFRRINVDEILDMLIRAGVTAWFIKVVRGRD